MIIKGSFLVPLDKSGVWSVLTIHLYSGFYKKFSVFGTFIKISVRSVKSNFIVLKKSKLKSIIILTKKEQIKNDGSLLQFQINGSILLKRRLTSIGKEIFGPTNYLLGRKRFLFSFSGLI